MMLQDAIKRTKENTCLLADTQFMKIQRLNTDRGWGMNIIDSTKVFEDVLRREDYKDLYDKIVFKPSMEMVKRFMEETSTSS